MTGAGMAGYWAVARTQAQREQAALLDDIRKREVGGYVKLPTPPKRFAHGQRVRIVCGPFEGHFGLYDGQAPRERCFVLLSLLGGQTRAEMADADVAVASP
jgi:hypothetical protein